MREGGGWLVGCMILSAAFDTDGRNERGRWWSSYGAGTDGLGDWEGLFLENTRAGAAACFFCLGWVEAAAPAAARSVQRYCIAHTMHEAYIDPIVAFSLRRANGGGGGGDGEKKGRAVLRGRDRWHAHTIQTIHGQDIEMIRWCGFRQSKRSNSVALCIFSLFPFLCMSQGKRKGGREEPNGKKQNRRKTPTWWMDGSCHACFRSLFVVIGLLVLFWPRRGACAVRPFVCLCVCLPS